jgi:hypothetical protein
VTFVFEDWALTEMKPEQIMTLDEFIELLQKHQQSGFGSDPVKMVRAVEQNGEAYHVYGDICFAYVGSNGDGEYAVIITDDRDIANMTIGNNEPMPEIKSTEDLTHLLSHVKNQQLS